MFTVFKKILQNKDLTDDDVAKVNSFVMCRWLQGNPGGLQVAQFLNVYHKLPLTVQVLFVKSVLAGKVKYIPYIKGQKITEDDLSSVSEYFKISRDKAIMYSEFLTDGDLKEIKSALDHLDRPLGK